jgi:hypothetical protein
MRKEVVHAMSEVQGGEEDSQSADDVQESHGRSRLEVPQL